MATVSRKGDFDYDAHPQRPGAGYSTHRQPDPRIAAMVHRALGAGKSVVNVGAGAGSYEPDDRHVIAVEPSEAMRIQRHARGRVPAIRGFAEDLPLDDASVDASMATVTIHQWSDLRRGLQEMRRVTRPGGPIVILSFVAEAMDRFWLARYVPELIAVEGRRHPPVSAIEAALGSCDVSPVQIPRDCTDGFTEAFYARPERFLDHGVRRSQSSWSFVEPGIEERFVSRLSADLDSGEWDRQYGHFRSMETFEGSLRLIVARA